MVLLRMRDPAPVDSTTVLHELEALRVLHGRLILDRLLVLLVVESDGVGIEVEDLAQLVGH